MKVMLYGHQNIRTVGIQWMLDPIVIWLVNWPMPYEQIQHLNLACIIHYLNGLIQCA